MSTPRKSQNDSIRIFRFISSREGNTSSCVLVVATSLCRPYAKPGVLKQSSSVFVDDEFGSYTTLQYNYVYIYTHYNIIYTYIGSESIMGIHMVGCTCYRCTRDLRQVFMDAGSQGMRLRRDSRALGP